MSEEKLSSLIKKESQDKMQAALTLLDSIKEVEIKTQDQYDNAINIQKDLKKAYKGLEDDRKAIVKPINDKVSQVNAKFKEVTMKLTKGGNTISAATNKWDQEQRRLADLEQKKREAEAEAKRVKLQKAAEAEAEKIAKYEAEGKTELAEKAQARMEDKQDEAATTVAAEVEKTQASGVSYRYDCDIEVTDSDLAIKSLLASPMTASMVSIDTVALKKMVKAIKGKGIDIPGIKVVDRSTQVLRS